MSWSTKEKRNAYYRKYRKTERYRKKTQTLEWKLKRSVARARFNERHRDDLREKHRIYYAENKEKEKKRYAKLYENQRFLMAIDADYAEMIRQGNRIRHRKHRDKTRKVPYKPRLSVRIPPFIPSFVSPLDRGSPFLRNNIGLNETRSIDNYARELNIEKRTWRERR